MPRKPPPTIPRRQVGAGVGACLTLAETLLREARALIQASGYLEQAAIVFSFAVEEFGKAVLLRDAYTTGVDPVTINGFYEHSPKLDSARKYIPEKKLLSSPAFQIDAFQGFQEGEVVDLRTRLSSLYVDWESGDWHHGVLVEADVLTDNITAVETIIREAKIEWSKTDM
jgi:AbiV family abortive infection protein